MLGFEYRKNRCSTSSARASTSHPCCGLGSIFSQLHCQTGTRTCDWIRALNFPGITWSVSSIEWSCGTFVRIVIISTNCCWCQEINLFSSFSSLVASGPVAATFCATARSQKACAEVRLHSIADKAHAIAGPGKAGNIDGLQSQVLPTHVGS